MGFHKSWDRNNIENQLFNIYHTCADPHNDGFTGLFAKKDLIELKFLISDLLEKTPRFIGEEEIYGEYLIKKLKQ